MKVAIYARVSTNDQHPENQKKSLIDYVENKGWEYDYFEEKETTRKTRPIKYALYQRLLKKEYNVVVVRSLRRWARSIQELTREIPALYKKDVKFISIRENIDLTSASGRLQFNMICAFAEFERDIISERTKEAFYVDDDGIKRSIKKNKKVGRPMGSKDRPSKPRRKSGYYQRWAK